MDWCRFEGYESGMKVQGRQVIPRRSGACGFTLIEILIASAVLAIVAVGSAAAIVTTPRILRSADESTSIRSAVHGMISELTAAEFGTMRATYNGKGFAVPGVTALDGDVDGLPGLITVETVGEGSALYYKLTLGVTWDGVNGARTVSSVHYISNVRGATAPPPEKS